MTNYSNPYRDLALYYVKSTRGDTNVARYIAKYNLFYAVGDSIGYFPTDLTIGKLVPLEGAFDDQSGGSDAAKS